MIKKYNRIRYREKFQKYRIFYLVLASVFLASLAGELFWFGGLDYRYTGSDVSFSAFFSDLFAGEALILLLVFLFGVTLYAPVFGIVSTAARGAFSGFCLAVLCSDLKSGKGVWLLVLSFFYLLFSAWLFLAYTTFCTTTALQIFSDPSKRHGGERRMYGGTLFYSAFSRGSVNLRFLMSYCLFFLGAVFLSFLLTLCFAGIRTLL